MPCLGLLLHHLLKPCHLLQKEKWASVSWIKNKLNFSFFFVTMAPKFDFLQAFIKTAAVSGIVLAWVNFTAKAFKMTWHIISTSPEEEKAWKAVSKVMFENCQKHFIDDGDELIYGKFLRETCRDYELEK